MNYENFKNKKIAVLGMGVEGVSSAAFLASHGATVTILDEKEAEKRRQYKIVINKYKK